MLVFRSIYFYRQVNGKDMTRSTHHDAVTTLISNVSSIKLLVRHDPAPPGLMVGTSPHPLLRDTNTPRKPHISCNVLPYLYFQEVTVTKYPGEKLGISIRGGAKGHPGNPLDPKDEGIFISKVCISSKSSRQHRLLGVIVGCNVMFTSICGPLVTTVWSKGLTLHIGISKW